MARVPGLSAHGWKPKKMKAAKEDDDKYDKPRPGDPIDPRAGFGKPQGRTESRKGLYVPPKPKGGKPDGQFGPKDPEPVPGTGKRNNSQPGPGAPTGGTGRDRDGGKGRTEFEDDRRGRNEGGKDRPPIYRPKDDGDRDGYINRSKPVATGGRGAQFLPTIDKRTVKQKLKDASSRK